MTTPYASIIRAARSQVWAVLPEKLEAIMAFLQLKSEGRMVDAETVARLHALAEVSAARAQKTSASGSGSVAVLPLYGLILQRPVGDISSPPSASVQKYTQQFRQAVNDPGVQAIVTDVDSPGGTVAGVDELAAEIRAARGKKPLIAVANCLMASAAYYIASAFDEIVVSPSSLTGSVGVYCMHEDASKYLENLGVKVTMIKFGENKGAGNPYEALSDSARADMQEMVDNCGDMFESAVAKGRKTTKANVHATFGQGKVFNAKQAVKIGMADSIGTLDDVLARFGISSNSQSVSMEDSSPSRMDKLDQRTSGLCRNEITIGAKMSRCTETTGHDGPHSDRWTGTTWALDMGSGDDAARSRAALKRRLEIASA